MGKVSGETPGKGERTFHDDLVGFHGHKDSVQRREQPNDTFGIDRSRQVVENDTGMVAALQQPLDFFGASGGIHFSTGQSLRPVALN